jgi:Protein tyrosine/serine phosphatase
MKVIDLEYTKNTRDIGGMKTQDGRQVKYNLLYRSGHLHRLSAKDIKTLEGLKIDYIIDFRSENEFVNKADYKFNNTQYINIPVLKKEEKKELLIIKIMLMLICFALLIRILVEAKK